MHASYHAGCGVVVRVYTLDKNEKIAKHQDPFQHTTSVARGRTEVEVYGRGTFEMRMRDAPRNLPADIDHEIRALEDDTIVINICPLP